MRCEGSSGSRVGSRRFLGMDIDSRREAEAAALHKLRSTLARLRAELELAELDKVPPGPAAFGALDDAFQQLTALELGMLPASGRVFVLDDDGRLAELFANRLRRRGFTVVSGTDLDAVVGQLQSGDRLVLDYGLIERLDDSQLARTIATTGAIVMSGAVGDVPRRR